MAPRQAASRRPGRRRPSRLESLIETAVDLVESVAVEVVPTVVDAVDVDDVIQRIDLNAVLAKVDMNELLEHVDVTRLLERVDIDALVARTELGSIMARSGGAVASRTLDVLRSQGVGLDAFVERWTDRLLRRGRQPASSGPALLVAHPELAQP